MMTKIQWTDCVWNPVVGCSRVSRGCEHCYAERVAHRAMTATHKGLTTLGKKGPRWTGEVRFLPERLEQPARWKKPRRVFVNSMSDLFHEGVDFEAIATVFGVMAAAPRHTFQVLTKRPVRALEFFEWVGANTWPLHPWPLPNVWLGVSVEDQATADERLPRLLECTAKVRWVSYEPALGPVDFGCYPAAGFGIDWVVVGGESGPGARPFDIEWARSTIRQCKHAGAPCFVKQLGSNPQPLFVAEGPARVAMARGLAPQQLWGPLSDRKGGDMSEWPADIQVREFPR